MRILIAEDEQITRRSLARQLEALGHTVVAAEDGEIAWEKFSTGISDATAGFDAVVTDWEMPRLSGLDLIKRIRATKTPSYVYIVMLTSRSDKADIVSGIEAGADDFLSKPFDKEELRVRLLAGERIVTLEKTLSVRNAELTAATDRIRFGLRAAARVQKAMLPQGCVVTDRVRTTWRYVPTDELAGDAVGIHQMDDRRVVCYVIDVSGHGVPAALLSVSAMHAIDPVAGPASLLCDASGAGGLGCVRRPSLVANALNQRFRSGDIDGRFMTMALCVLDTNSGVLTYSSAGHPPMLVLRKTREAAEGHEFVEVSDAGGPPIAIIDGCEYEEATLQLLPGDRVFLYSDGFLEQTPPGQSEQFGESGLRRSILAHRAGSIDTLADALVDDLAVWAGARSFEDDVSLVVVEWLGT